jgi:hypothetical protein
MYQFGFFVAERADFCLSRSIVRRNESPGSARGTNHAFGATSVPGLSDPIQPPPESLADYSRHVHCRRCSLHSKSVGGQWICRIVGVRFGWWGGPGRRRRWRSPGVVWMWSALRDVAAFEVRRTMNAHRPDQWGRNHPRPLQTAGVRDGEFPVLECARGELNPHALSGTRT